MPFLQEEEHTFASTKLGGSKTLKCGSQEDDEEAKVHWEVTAEGQNNTLEVKAVEDKFVMDGVKLTIKDVQEEDLGVYRSSLKFD